MVRKPNTSTSFDGLCEAAAVSLQGNTDHFNSPRGGDGSRASEIKVMEVDAFSSVHDMIHAAIISHGVQATLRQVYQACEAQGRIAYKRSGGSRLIFHNPHWKSQIRHALYTCDRFQRVAEGADLWMISPAFQHMQPQTTKVLIRSDSNAGSISDGSQMEGLRQTPQQQQPQRRPTRAKAPPEQDPPFLAVSQRKKRTSRQAMAQAVTPAKKPTEAGRGSPAPFRANSEQFDECSHIDHLSGLHVLPGQAWQTPPPASSQMDCTVAPSPLVRMGTADNNAWQRAARRLNSALNGVSTSCEDKQWKPLSTGSDVETGPSANRARSAEAESPASTQQLYALRSRSKPPPGFGDNPDPAAERAAREAHASTQGPLKKRLKAAAKAAEMAATAASAVNEEATSTHTELRNGPVRGATPSVADASCNTGKPPIAWRPGGSTPPPFAAPAQNLRSRGRGRGMSLIDQVTAQPTHGARLASLSSYGEAEYLPNFMPLAMSYSETPSDTHCRPSSAKPGRQPLVCGVGAFQQGEDAEEGADETDEGGGKRLLRSHAAAAAADLERDGTLDRTGQKC